MEQLTVEEAWVKGLIKEGRIVLLDDCGVIIRGIIKAIDKEKERFFIFNNNHGAPPKDFGLEDLPGYKAVWLVDGYAHGPAPIIIYKRKYHEKKD